MEVSPGKDALQTPLIKKLVILAIMAGAKKIWAKRQIVKKP
jgi:hypothetical protein